MPQYKFGARWGTAPVLLGLLKMGLALLFGSSLLQLLQYFPQPMLGAMLLMSGLELAASVRKETDARGCSFMLLTAAAILGLGDTAVGFVVGVGGCAAVALYEWGSARLAAATSTGGRWHWRGGNGASRREVPYAPCSAESPKIDSGSGNVC
jgi:MFS superfamily sulfate permease-like transporter